MVAKVPQAIQANIEHLRSHRPPVFAEKTRGRLARCPHALEHLARRRVTLTLRLDAARRAVAAGTFLAGLEALGFGGVAAGANFAVAGWDVVGLVARHGCLSVAGGHGRGLAEPVAERRKFTPPWGVASSHPPDTGGITPTNSKRSQSIEALEAKNVPSHEKPESHGSTELT